VTALLKLPKEQMAALRFEDIRLYLTSRNWQLDEDASSDGVGIYRLPGEPDAEIVLPLRRDWGDYPERMAEVVWTLAAAEERPVWEVITDLSGPAGDVLRFRVIAPNATLGTMPLDDGLRLLQGGHDLLLAAACSAHQAQAYYPRQSFSEALDFVRECRVGQTERGSYVSTIIAPVPVDLQPTMFTDSLAEEDQIATEPYPRRVTLQLMNSLRVVRQSIQAGKPEEILQGISAGISANLCEALTAMTPSSEQATVEIRTTWSRSRPRVPRSLPHAVSFAQGDFAVIAAAGRRLREGFAPRRQRIEGVIVSLHAETDLFEDFKGKVVMRTELGGRTARVRFVLGRDDYSCACDAHRDGKRVAIAGVLQRDPRSKLFDLLHPQGFEVPLNQP
jgi:hypothetical protein